jgi:hypothetical protein
LPIRNVGREIHEKMLAHQLSALARRQRWKKRVCAFNCFAINQYAALAPDGAVPALRSTLPGVECQNSAGAPAPFLYRWRADLEESIKVGGPCWNGPVLRLLVCTLEKDKIV